jgi:TM2 domain-containing membrane protein YozV
LHGFIYNELNLFNKAKNKFVEYNNANNQLSLANKDSLNAFVNLYYTPKKIPHLKSLKKARTLSKILPGAGLFYAGKPGKALVNISFQLLAAGYTGLNIYAQNYLTAASAGWFLMRSFYTGGVNQLNEVIPAVNYKKTSNFNANFKTNYIQKLNNYAQSN